MNLKSSKILYSISYLSSPISAFILAPILARSLFPEDRGLYASITGVTIILTVIFGFGIEMAITSSNQNTNFVKFFTDLYKSMFWSLIFIPFILGTVFCALYFSGTLLGDFWFVVVLSFGILSLGSFNITASWARSISSGESLVVLNVLPAIVRTLSILVLFFTNYLTVKTAVVVALFSGLPAIIYIFVKNPRELTLKIDADQFVDSDLRFVRWRTYLNSILVVFSYRGLQALAIFIIDRDQAGIFAVSFSLCEACILVARSFRDRLYAGEHNQMKKIIRDGISVTVFLSLLLFLLAQIFYVSIFGSAYAEGREILGMLLVATCFQGLYEFYSVYFIRNRKFKLSTFHTLLLILNLGLFSIVFKDQNARGLSAAILISYVISLLLVILNTRKYRTQREPKK